MRMLSDYIEKSEVSISHSIQLAKGLVRGIWELLTAYASSLIIKEGLGSFLQNISREKSWTSTEIGDLGPGRHGGCASSCLERFEKKKKS